MLGPEEIGLLAFEIHDADEAVLGDEGDGQLRADVGIGGDVEVRSGDVVEQNGLAGERDLADDSFADRNARALYLRRVADLKAHAQLVRAVVEKKDSEDAIGNDGANEFGGAAEQGLQIERGVERVGEAHQIGDIGGLDAGVQWDRDARGSAGR